MSSEEMAGFIRELRIAKGMTQSQLAEQLHITDKAVSKWERGQGYPDITVLNRLADILNVTTTELLNGSRDSDFEAQPAQPGQLEQPKQFQRTGAAVKKRFKIPCSTQIR